MWTAGPVHILNMKKQTSCVAVCPTQVVKMAQRDVVAQRSDCHEFGEMKRK